MAGTMRRKRKPAGKVKLKLDTRTQRKIRKEAKRLKLSEAEYLILMTHFSEAVRTASLPAGILDSGWLKMILGNPMMMDMIKGMLRNMVSQMSEEYTKTPSASSAPTPAPQQPWYGQGQGPSTGWMNPYANPQAESRPTNNGSGFGAPMWPQQQPQERSSSGGGLGGLTDMFMKFFGNN